MWLLAEGIPTDEINPWNGEEDFPLNIPTRRYLIILPVFPGRGFLKNKLKSSWSSSSSRTMASPSRCVVSTMLSSWSDPGLKAFRKLAAPIDLKQPQPRPQNRQSLHLCHVQDKAVLKPHRISRPQAEPFQPAKKGCCPWRKPTARFKASPGRRFPERKCQELFLASCAPGPGLSRCRCQASKGRVPVCYEDGPCVVSIVGRHLAQCLVHPHHIPGPGGMSPTPRRYRYGDRECNSQDRRKQTSSHHRARDRFQKGPARLCALPQAKMPRHSGKWPCVPECQRPAAHAPTQVNANLVHHQCSCEWDRRLVTCTDFRKAVVTELHSQEHQSRGPAPVDDVCRTMTYSRLTSAPTMTENCREMRQFTLMVASGRWCSKIKIKPSPHT